MTSSVDLFERFTKYSKTLVETGLYVGQGIQCALDVGFEKIYSCDINSEYVENAKKKFKGKNVVIENMHSPDFLRKVFSEIDERVVVFLDAHSMPYDLNDPQRGFGDDTVRDGLPPCPLLEELQIIKDHHIDNHTILIDDYQCFDTWSWDGLQFDDVNDFVLSINPKYKSRILCQNVLCYTIKD